VSAMVMKLWLFTRNLGGIRYHSRLVSFFSLMM